MTTLDFEYSEYQLNNLANQILQAATDNGASSAQVEINESIATNVDILNSEIENFENSYDRTMVLSVYLGNKRGNVGVTDIKIQDIPQTVNKAISIAKYTEDDIANNIADKEFLCTSLGRELSLYNPVDLDNQSLINRAKNIEQLGLSFDKRVTNSDGASISSIKHNFVIANTNGLNLGYKTTRYSTSISLIASSVSGMQTDYWYTSSRDYNDLCSDHHVANTAVKRLLRRLSKGNIKAGKYMVIFESQIAKSIIGCFLSGINGQSLFRRLSFLNDSLDTSIFPNWLSIYEDPFITKGLSSCYFDNEGVRVTPRHIVENGIVKKYVLSSYTARKLNMYPTGNAGGTHNVMVSNNFSGDVSSLAEKMVSGLIVIETIGHGLNMVTGDYSVGASGLWVENGEIRFFVDNITISGNLKTIFKNIICISDDYKGNSSMLCGSMLVDGVTVSI